MGCGIYISEDESLVELHSSGKLNDDDEGIIFFEKPVNEYSKDIDFCILLSSRENALQ